MSTFPPACKAIHGSPSPSSREQTFDSVGLVVSQGGCLTHDQGQVLGAELGLMEMTDAEYTHLQHFIQAHMEVQAEPPDARAQPAGVIVQDATRPTAMSPFTTTQAIDLSTSTDEHCLLMPGEKTPASYGEVPGFVLARIRGEDSPTEPLVNSSASSRKRSGSAARVCLEKRFNTMSADAPKHQDIQSAVLTNFLTILQQQSAEVQHAPVHPQIQKWIRTDRANPFEGSSPYVGGVFNPVTNMCGQVIGHIPHLVESHKSQSLIIPKGFSFSFLPERVLTKAHFTRSNPTEEKKLVTTDDDVRTPAASRKRGSTRSSQPIKAAMAAPDSAGEIANSQRKRSQSGMSLSQRRERHNTKERERRKRIRLCCDELNMLVPFCDLDTDKVTTLHWTTAFLQYINKTYGDTFKEEFQKTVTDEKRLFFKSSPSSGQDPVHRERVETGSIPLSVEQ